MTLHGGDSKAVEAPTAEDPRRLAQRERSENFPVVLRLLPRRHREALHAVYAFARFVDDLGDRAPGDRVAQLRDIDEGLSRAWAGELPVVPVLAGLQRTVVGRVPERCFHDLVSANLQDQRVSRYDTFGALVDYCRLSADPVGRIVLAIFGHDHATEAALSDRVCTALQLLEHWQDVAEDRRAGRIYLPQEDLERFGVAESDLDRPVAGPALARLMRFEIERAADLLTQGAPLVRRLHGWARPCVAGFVAGGQATVTALRRTGGDVLGRPTVPSRATTAVRLVRLLAAGPTHPLTSGQGGGL